jgi:ubiquitin C-terminal hydrolase
MLFRYERGVRSKVKARISLPPNRLIRLPLTVDNEKRWFTYELRALLVHRGDTLEGGHYTTFVKEDGSSWWWVSDAAATPTTYA